jgi:hypothetical protein
VLYIASALNVPLYPYQKHQTLVMGGTTIIRDFTTVPAWLFLAWGYFLSQPKKTPWTLVALGVLACAEILNYTRTAIGMLVVTAALVACLMLVRQGRRRRGVVVGAAGAVVAALALSLLPAVLPAQMSFLQSRFEGLEGAKGILADPTFNSRFVGFSTARRTGALTDPLFGAGLFDASPLTNGDQYFSGDGDIQRVVYRTGVTGVVVFVAPFMMALFVAIGSLARRGLNIAAEGLMLTGAVWTLVCVFSFLGGGIFFWWPPLSLLGVALIAHATGFPVATPRAVSVGGPLRQPGRVASGL